MMSEQIKVMVKKPDAEMFITSIDNSLQAFQKAVSGYIEVIQIGGSMAVICNAEGRLSDSYNCTVNGKPLYGTLLITGIDSEEITGIKVSTKKLLDIANALGTTVDELI